MHELHLVGPCRALHLGHPAPMSGMDHINEDYGIEIWLPLKSVCGRSVLNTR